MFNFLNQKSQYEKYAEEAVAYLVEGNKPLNESITTLARAHELNPEQIKRVVEAANVLAFQKNLENPDREGKKDVDFDVADAQNIIKAIYVDGMEPSSADEEETIPEEDASPLDFFTKIVTKVAPELSTEKPVLDDGEEFDITGDKPTLILRIRAAKQNLEKEAFILADSYDKVATDLARTFRHTGCTKDFGAMCLNAYEHMGDSCVPTLEKLASMTKKTMPSFDVKFNKIASEKTADVQTIENLVYLASESNRYSRAADVAELVLNKLTK